MSASSLPFKPYRIDYSMGRNKGSVWLGEEEHARIVMMLFGQVESVHATLWFTSIEHIRDAEKKLSEF